MKKIIHRQRINNYNNNNNNNGLFKKFISLGNGY